MSAQVAADLRTAAEVLRRDGWTQELYHRYVDGKVCHCAEGAIGVATGSHRDLRFDPRVEGDVDYDIALDGIVADRRDFAIAALREQIGHAANVPEWNDRLVHSPDEVIAALEAAADAAEAQR